MNLVILTPRSPWPPTMADSMTIDRMVRFLAAKGHAVRLLSFVQNEEEERGLRAALGGICQEIGTVQRPAWRSYLRTALTLPGRHPMAVQYYASPEMHALVARHLPGCDLVYAHSIRMAEFARHLERPRVLGMQTSQALNTGRMIDHVSDPLRGLFYRLEHAKVRPYEANVCADFDLVLLCGPADIAELEKTRPVSNAAVCPHGQDAPPLERVRASQREPGAIVITGVMSTYTNVDGVCWFAQEVFPSVLREVPEARFWIVGRNPQRAIMALARPPQIIVTGEVPDVYAWLCRAQVGIDPVRIGAGMQNKLIQAMACELPVVATTVANEGIGASPETHLLLRDDPDSTAAAVIDLLRDEQKRQRVGRAAREFIEANWTWEVHFEKFEKLLAGVIRGAGSAPSAAD